MANSPYATLQIEGPDLSQTLTVSSGSVTLGRHSSNEIHIASPLVSRKHASISCGEEGCLVEDLGSSNGTLLNGELLEPNVPVLLQDGDKIEVGPFEVTFQAAAVATAAVAGEGETPPEEPEVVPPEESLEPEPETPQAGQEKGASDPPTPPPIPPVNGSGVSDALPPIPPGLDRYSRHFLQYLPPIYHTDFVSRFLALFEAMFKPTEWTIDSFDMFLDPRTAPKDFLPWLQNWFLVTFDDTWSEESRRTFLQEAHQIYARRGTKWALERILEIYLGQKATIDDSSEQLEPLTFLVQIPLAESKLDRELVENLIDLNKPSHTTYQLAFAP